MIYREAQESDIELISAQIVTSIKAAYAGMMSEEYLSSLTDGQWVPILKNSFAEGRTCIIALDEGKIIGSAVFGRESSGKSDGTAELFAIYLLPDCVGKGIGHALYCEAEKAMIVQGFSVCMLEALTANKRAIDFYKTRGYRPTEIFEVTENGMTLECIRMDKNLQVFFEHDLHRNKG